MNNGWIKAHRKLLDWEWYDDTNVVRLFLHCLLRANHKPNKWRGIQINSGQFITSQESLSKEIGLSVRQIRVAINKLKTTGELTVKTTNKFSLISITNWNSYQSDDRQDDNQMTIKCHSNDNQMTTNKNDKNVNNEKEYINTSPSTKADHVPYQKIIDLYHEILPELPECKKLTTKRKGQIRQRHIQDIEDLDTWREYFEYIRQSNFLMGRVPPREGRTPFCATLEWLTNESNYAKIYEEKYHG